MSAFIFIVAICIGVGLIVKALNKMDTKDESYIKDKEKYYEDYLNPNSDATRRIT